MTLHTYSAKLRKAFKTQLSVRKSYATLACFCLSTSYTRRIPFFAKRNTSSAKLIKISPTPQRETISAADGVLTFPRNDSLVCDIQTKKNTSWLDYLVRIRTNKFLIFRMACFYIKKMEYSLAVNLCIPHVTPRPRNSRAYATL